MAEKMITLTESFRVVLRSMHSQRPGLADEIQSNDYFRSPFDKGTGRRVDPEVQAADDALAVLRDAIVGQSVRLHGRFEGNPPADIDPTEIARTGIFVFENALDVWQPTTKVSSFRQLRIYLNVHCYAAEIDALIGAAAADDPEQMTIDAGPRLTNEQACIEVKAIATTERSPKRVGRRPAADWDVVRDALRLEIDRRGMIGPDNDADWRIQADVERFVSAILEERNEAVAESTVRDRVSNMLKSIEAGN
jgi:hypothetical protein